MAQATSAVKKGGDLVLAQAGDPPTLDPHMSTAANTTNFVRLIYSQLMRYKISSDPLDLSIEPSVAKNVEIVDGLTYRFKLRDDVRMHDVSPVSGRLVTAADVKYSFERLQQKETAQASLYTPIKSIEAIDASTVIFHLTAPYAPFMDIIAEPQTSWIVPQEIIKADKDLGKRPVGSGPFIFERIEASSRYSVTRNPKYFEAGRPNFDRVTRVIQNDQAALTTGFSTNKVHAIGAEPLVLKQLQALPKKPTVVSVPGTTSQSLVMQNKLAPFTDVRVRKAIAKAINQQRIIDVGLQGAGGMSGPIPAGLAKWVLSDSVLRTAYAYDVAGAKQLLAAAGQGAGFEVKLLALNTISATEKSIVELIQQDLSQIGVKVSIVIEDQAIGRKHGVDGAFPLYYPGGKTTALEPDVHVRENFLTGASRNWSFISDPDIDGWIKQQGVITKEEERRQLVLQIQQRVLELMPEVFVPRSLTSTVIRPELRDYWPSVNGDRPSEITAWLDA